VIRPLLADRRGWATFIGTPKGKNAFWQLWDEAAGDWFKVMLKASETGLIDSDELDAARRQMTDDQYAQEFECSFEAAIQGAYFGTEMRQAAEEKRIVGVPYEASSEVITAWDLGIGDSTAIWFAQVVGREIRLIDYYEARLAGPEHYIKVIREKPYTYSRHVLPHDADLSRLETGGKSLKEILWAMGLSVEIGTKLTKEEQIAHGRLLFPRIWIDKDKCEAGIGALASWHFAFDDQKQTLGRTPVHDWASHASDAFCLIGVMLREMVKSKKIVYPSMGYV
jgi:hypothetical protein